MLRKISIQLWIYELMRLLNCQLPDEVEMKIYRAQYQKKARTRPRLFQTYLSGLHFPNERTRFNCEEAVKGSNRLITHPIWEILKSPIYDRVTANLFLSQLNHQHLGGLKKDWFLSTVDLFNDSLIATLVRFTTLDSVSALVVILKLAKAERDFNEINIAKQLYHALLILGIQIPETENLRKKFFLLFCEHVLEKVNWAKGAALLDSEIYLFSIKKLDCYYPINKHNGLILPTKGDLKSIRERSTGLFYGLQAHGKLEFLSDLRLIYVPEEIAFAKSAELKALLITRLGDLIEMGYPITECLSFTGKDINIHINDYQVERLFASWAHYENQYSSLS